MPPLPNPQTSYVRNARLRQLLVQARNPTPSNLRPLVGGLRSNANHEFFTSLLDDLDPRKIPALSGVAEPSSLREFDRALSAIIDITSIFHSFTLEAQQPDVVALRIRYGELVVERWSSLMKWLVYLILQAHRHPTPPTILTLCTEALLRITVAEKKDAWQEELVYLPHTPDFIFLLLRQVDPRRQSYYYIPTTHSGCAILNLLSEYVKGFTTYLNAIDRLKAIAPRARHKVVASLALRAKQIADIGIGPREELGVGPRTTENKMWTALKSLYTLTHSTSQVLCEPVLWRIYLKHNTVYEHATAVTMISVKAHELEGGSGTTDGGRRVLSESFWKLLVEAVIWYPKTLTMGPKPQPISSIASAIKGGLVHTALHCLIHIDPLWDANTRLIDQGFATIIPYITTRRGYLALSNGYRESFPNLDLDTLLDLAERTSERAKQVCKAMRQAVVWGAQVYGGPVERGSGHSGMCGNRKHSTQRTFESGSEACYRVCSRCHSMVYCSQDCQREDWDMFHSDECERFKAWYNGNTEIGHSLSVAARRDHVLYLENVANRTPLPLVDRNTGQTKPAGSSTRLPGQIYNSDSTIVVFEFTSLKRFGLPSRYPLNFYHEMRWKYINLDWQPRILKICRDVEASRGRSFLVEGVFPHNDELSVYVMVKLSTSESATGGQRYIAQESVWRHGPRSAIK